MTRPHLANPEKQPDDVAVLRGQIDGLDQAIIRLVAERTILSGRIQAARIKAGGTRVETGRERQVLDSYRRLGPHGTTVAEAILTIGRGKLVNPEPAIQGPAPIEVLDPSATKFVPEPTEAVTPQRPMPPSRP